MTVEEYFRFEEESSIKHEYVAGEVYAMSGATTRHNRLALGIAARLFTVAIEHGCDVFASDMRVEAGSEAYYYPDIAVVCKPLGDDDIVARGPCVVIEVTSPSTARIDRGEKLVAYRRISELRAYLIVDHRRRRVERHWRDSAEGEWSREEIVGADIMPIPVPCLDTTLTLDEIYARVNLPAVGEPNDVEYSRDA